MVVPVKRLARAKSRLSTRPAPVRRELALAFALDVVAACTAAPSVRAVVVVADDAHVRSGAEELGAYAVPDDAGAGLVPALLLGRERALARRPDSAVAMLAGDLPALRAADVEYVLDRAAAHERAFVADLIGTGTTMLCAGPGVDPRPRFGPRSRAAHAASGAVELTGPELVRVRCDVDTEVDLWYARTLGVGPRTATVLSHLT